MAAYAPGELEMGLEERTVVLVEKKSSARWLWKMSGALLGVALCFGGFLFFVWHWNGRQDILMQAGQREALIESDTAEKTEPHSTLRRIGSRAKAAIHLEGFYDEDKSMEELEWRSDQGQAFTQGGFRLTSNQIIIPQTGLYFVYSQASFRVTCGVGEGAEAKKRLTPLSHEIWRYSDSLGDEAPLMSTVRSACQQGAQEDGYKTGQGWYNAIYLGAVFQLNRGDKIRTETNQLSALETDDGRTFFGAFAL